MFGLTGPQGNHGEDVKEYWWYLDATPTSSFLRWRYHYPQTRFPFEQLVAENERRTRLDPEFELVDTGAFSEGRFWIVTVDWAKADPDDLLWRIEVINAGPDEAAIDVLPQPVDTPLFLQRIACRAQREFHRFAWHAFDERSNRPSQARGYRAAQRNRLD